MVLVKPPTRWELVSHDMAQKYQREGIQVEPDQLSQLLQKAPPGMQNEPARLIDWMEEQICEPVRTQERTAKARERFKKVIAAARARRRRGK